MSQTPDASKSRYLELTVAVVLAAILIAQFMMPDTPDSDVREGETDKASTRQTTPSIPIPSKAKASEEAAVAVSHSTKPRPAREPEPTAVTQTVLELTSSMGPVKVSLDGLDLGTTPISTNVPFAEKSRQLTFKRRGYKTQQVQLGGQLRRFEYTVTLQRTVKRKSKAPFELKPQ